jgi:hypothetical protein
MLDAPNCTQIPNDFLNLIDTYTNEELRVLLLLCFNEFKWERIPEMSLTNIAQRTGLNEQQIITAYNSLKEIDAIKRVDHNGESFFSLIVED